MVRLPLIVIVPGPEIPGDKMPPLCTVKVLAELVAKRLPEPSKVPPEPIVAPVVPLKAPVRFKLPPLMLVTPV